MMRLLGLQFGNRAVFELNRRSVKFLLAVAACLVATDLITLLQTPFPNIMALAALLVSLVLLGASIKLLMGGLSENSA